MTRDADPVVQLVAASLGDKPILLRLREFWHYDFSEILGADIGDDGIYGFGDVDPYFLPPNFAHLLKVNGRLAGFALCDGAGDGLTFLDSFFVMRAHRRRHVGSAAVRRLLDSHPGRWGLNVRPQNQAALAFWRNILPAVARDVHEEEREWPDGAARTTFRFTA